MLKDYVGKLQSSMIFPAISGGSTPMSNLHSQMNDSTSQKCMETVLICLKNEPAGEISSPQTPMKVCNDYTAIDVKAIPSTPAKQVVGSTMHSTSEREKHGAFCSQYSHNPTWLNFIIKLDMCGRKNVGVWCCKIYCIPLLLLWKK